MNKKIKSLLSLFLSMLSACSQQATKLGIETSVDSVAVVEKIAHENQFLGLTKIKAGKKLKLARVLEGGACKNDQQGAVGVFKLYTNPDDVERIENNQGVEVFADFESLIIKFSMQSLQQAINTVDFQTKDNETNRESIKQNLAALFIDLVADDIAKFERETTLMIDIIPEVESLTIFLNGCETPHDH